MVSPDERGPLIFTVLRKNPNDPAIQITASITYKEAERFSDKDYKNLERDEGFKRAIDSAVSRISSELAREHGVYLADIRKEIRVGSIELLITASIVGATAAKFVDEIYEKYISGLARDSVQSEISIFGQFAVSADATIYPAIKEKRPEVKEETTINRYIVAAFVFSLIASIGFTFYMHKDTERQISSIRNKIEEQRVDHETFLRNTIGYFMQQRIKDYSSATQHQIQEYPSAAPKRPRERSRAERCTDQIEGSC